MTDTSRHPPAVARLLVGAGVGAVAGLLIPAIWPWEARVLVGWVLFCATVLLWLRLALWTASPERTRALALREDDTRALAGTVTLVASLVSLVGVIFALHQAGGEKGAASVALTVLAVLTVAASWLLVHAEYTLHYARKFYTDGGGVTFPKEGGGTLEDPDYRDFAYLSLTIGMTRHRHHHAGLPPPAAGPRAAVVSVWGGDRGRDHQRGGGVDRVTVGRLIRAKQKRPGTKCSPSLTSQSAPYDGVTLLSFALPHSTGP